MCSSTIQTGKATERRNLNEVLKLKAKHRNGQ